MGVRVEIASGERPIPQRLGPALGQPVTWVELLTKRAGSGNAFAGGESGCRGATAHPEFGENVGQVPRDGLLAQVELCCDRPVRLACGHEPQHLRCPLGQAAGQAHRLSLEQPLARIRDGRMSGRAEERSGLLQPAERNCQYLWIKIFYVAKGAPEVINGRVVGVTPNWLSATRSLTATRSSQWGHGAPGPRRRHQVLQSSQRWVPR